MTTGETWQFLRLADPNAWWNRTRYDLDNVGRILSVLRLIVDRAIAAASAESERSG